MFFLWTFVACVVALIGWGLFRKGGGYQYPVLAGVTFGGWLLPQAIGMQYAPFLPDWGYERFLLMATLCALMTLVGYLWPSRPMSLMGWDYSKPLLLRAAFALTFIGACFSFLYDVLPATRTDQGQMSGLSVILLFFADMKGYGFAIAVLLFVRTRSRWALTIAGIGAYFYLQSIVLGGRRAATSEFVFIILLSYWFARGKAVKSSIFIAVLALGMLGSASIGDYRATSQGQGLSYEELTSIGWVENVQEMISQGGLEAETAIYQMSAIEETSDYDYGTYHWNRLVFRYVPAQIVGNDVKQALYLKGGASKVIVLAKDRNEITTNLYDLEKILGVTATGFTDAFGSFWYFGAIKFFIIAFVMSKVYGGAVRGNVSGGLIYMMLVTPAMHAVTHNTSWFFEAIPHMILFLLPALLYARVVSRRYVTAPIHESVR